MEGNSIFANGGQGIDLGPNDGPTPNDLNDADTTAPTICSTGPCSQAAFLSGTSLYLTGFVNTEVNKVLRIEFFANPADELKAQTFLGFLNVSMGANNTVVFTTTLTVPRTGPGGTDAHGHGHRHSGQHLGVLAAVDHRVRKGPSSRTPERAEAWKRLNGH